jgi:hypothetical protein
MDAFSSVDVGFRYSAADSMIGFSLRGESWVLKLLVSVLELMHGNRQIIDLAFLIELVWLPRFVNVFRVLVTLIGS